MKTTKPKNTESKRQKKTIDDLDEESLIPVIIVKNSTGVSSVDVWYR
jgi:hypothetical protein